MALTDPPYLVGYSGRWEGNGTGGSLRESSPQVERRLFRSVLNPSTEEVDPGALAFHVFPAIDILALSADSRRF